MKDAKELMSAFRSAYRHVRPVRRIMWNKDWQPAEGAFDKQRLPKALATRGGRRRLVNAALRRATASDFVVAGVEDHPDSPAWNVKHARWHDLAADLGPSHVVWTSVFTGGELIERLKGVAETKAPTALWPATLAGEIDPQARYRLCGDLLHLVRPLEKNLPNVAQMRVDLFKEVQRIAGRAEKRAAGGR